MNLVLHWVSSIGLDRTKEAELTGIVSLNPRFIIQQGVKTNGLGVYHNLPLSAVWKLMVDSKIPKI